MMLSRYLLSDDVMLWSHISSERENSLMNHKCLEKVKVTNEKPFHAKLLQILAVSA